MHINLASKAGLVLLSPLHTGIVVHSINGQLKLHHYKHILIQTYSFSMGKTHVGIKSIILLSILIKKNPVAVVSVDAVGSASTMTETMKSCSNIDCGDGERRGRRLCHSLLVKAPLSFSLSLFALVLLMSEFSAGTNSAQITFLSLRGNRFLFSAVVKCNRKQ